MRLLQCEACECASSCLKNLNWHVLGCSHIHRYLDWVHCPNELPPTLSAYKTQQFRWNR